jgi:hypothetical protein
LGFSIESANYSNSVEEGADILIVTLEIKEIRDLVAIADTISLSPKLSVSADTCK